MVNGASGDREKTMPSDRVVISFVVTAEMGNDEENFEAVLAALPGTIDDVVLDATNVFADIMDVEDIT